MNNILWMESYKHFIIDHDITPTSEFIMHIMNIKIINDTIINLPVLTSIKLNTTFVKIDLNQINIMESLYEHGSKKKYIKITNKKNFIYSEHAGMLQFSDNKLTYIIISATTDRINENDPFIYLPSDDQTNKKFKYIFHTHPLTPKIGSRIENNGLYEFPSVKDILYFIKYYNMGTLVGSIIITPEGIYVIHRNIIDNKQITFNNLDNTIEHLSSIIRKIQKQALKHYDNYNITSQLFYEQVAQNRSYIKLFNQAVNKINIDVDYYPRQYINKTWRVDELYLPIYINYN